MRILYISLKINNNSYGGKVITSRNLHVIKSCFGEENVVKYELPFCQSRIIRYLKYLFLKIGGVNITTERKLKRIIAEKNIDCVFFDTSLFGLFSKEFIKKNSCITFFHNVEAEYSELSVGDSLPEKYKKFAIQFVERRNCLYSSKVITLNQRDSEGLKKRYGRGADIILPSSMNDTFRKYEESELPENKDYLLFVGSNFFGNTEGLFDFIENCLPEINSRLVVVGNGMDVYQGKYDTDKVKFYGFVEDLGPFYAGAKAVVLPIISGSGMKTKTCESLMQGKVIFGTNEAFEGFDHIDEADCVLCNSNEELINNINAYLSSDEVSYFSEKSRRVFLEYYSNDAALKLLEEGLNSFINENQEQSANNR